MTDYAKVSARFLYSKNSDYSEPTIDTNNLTSPTALTPDEWEYREIQADTGGNTVDLGHFASVTAICVWNLDATNFVDVQFSSDTDANTVKVNALGFIALSNIDVTVADDLILTADTAACECLVAICGT